MTEKNVNFNWNHARAFLITAKLGSLSAAAKSLEISQPTLSRQVSALEEELSTVLFDRGPRGLMLTKSGLALLEYVSTMGEAASSLSLAASGRSTSIEGEILISAPEMLACLVLPEILSRMRKKLPGIRVVLVSSNEVSDLRRRGADIAIRSFRPHEFDLITKKVGKFTATLYATNDVIERFNFKTMLSNDGPIFLGFSSNNQAYINALVKEGISLNENSFIAKSDSHIALWQMTKCGLGIGMAPTPIGDNDPNTKRIFRNKIFGGDYWIVSHRELRMSLKVKSVFEFLSDELSNYLQGNY